QHRRSRARRGRAPRAGGHRPLRRRHRLGRPARGLRARGQRQGVPRLWRLAGSHPGAPARPLTRRRDVRRRARARALRTRRARVRAVGRRTRRTFHFRAFGPPDLRAHRRARASAHGRGDGTGGAARPPRPRARCRMTHEEIIQGLYDNTLVGNAPEVMDLTNKGLEEGMDPEKMLYEGLIPSLEEVGARFERGDFFVPEMLIAARAMQGALDILRPLLAETGAQQVGTYVMGTVKGDVHDIG